MDISLCTISFRHHLTSIESIAGWASRNRFQGIELWGVHALNLATEAQYGAEWLNQYRLRASMLSDYLPLDGDETLALSRTRTLAQLATRWGAPQLRTFAGQRSSAATPAPLRRQWVRRLRRLCEELQEQDLLLLVETHPGTLADTANSTRQLLEEVDHPALRINFDVLHVWEAGDDPISVLAELQPWVAHFHLKNITRRDQLGVFAPGNVYAPAGTREGMVPLMQGAFGYSEFLPLIVNQHGVGASLEWFGNDVQPVLAQDLAQIRQLQSTGRSCLGQRDVGQRYAAQSSRQARSSRREPTPGVRI
ncbi:MAG: 3-dehydroshikimate dehydratase [Alteromonadaceae bacterium]|nr:3-dehydroshikimate dehydratase [Alteromonadaceae bacterium]